MLPDSNICSFPRPGRDDVGRCDIGDELSHHMILDAPNIIGDDVSIDNSQTPRGPNAMKHRPVYPSHREEIWVINTEYRISTKGRKTESNQTKPSTDLKRVEKSKVMVKKSTESQPRQSQKVNQKKKTQLEGPKLPNKKLCVMVENYKD
ncbi:hypothetical protein Tco_1215159 [Tanacetum coccineum]